MRKTLTGNMTTRDVVIEMSEGSPGAINAMMVLLNEGGTLLDLLHLDDMNIWGPQIWIAFKDHCDRDPVEFLRCIRVRDPKMISTVNREYSKADEEAAVTHGGSNRDEPVPGSSLFGEG